MSLASLAAPKTSTPARGGLAGLAGMGARPTIKPDLTTIEGLSAYAGAKGLGRQAAKITDTTPRLSPLQRLSKGLGAFNPAEAILTGTEKGAVAGVIEYPKRIVQGVGAALTGTDYGGEQRTFKDVVEKTGIENGVAKFGLGFLGDVLLDPTTYFGGAIIRGVGAGVKGAANVSLKGVGKVAPATEAGLRMAGTGVKDALAKGFVAGYKASTGAQTDVLTFLSKRDAARFGIAASNLNRLGTGVLTKNQQEELALKLVAGKRAEFGAREAGHLAGDTAQVARHAAQSTDPVVQKTIESQLTRSQKFGSQLNLENPYEVYFPFIKKDKLDTFLKGVSGKGIQVGSEGYRKQFKNLLTNENLELDPAKAFFTAEAAQVSDRMTRDFLAGFASKYGKSLDAFKNSDEAAKAGYKIIRDKGAFGKEVGYATEFDAKLLSDLITPEFQTINMIAKATGFDAVTNLFKRAVTGLFLPFHVRNFASGMIQNFEGLGVAALNPKTIAAGQKMAYLMARGKKPAEDVIEVAGKTVKFSKVFKAFSERFGSDTFYHNDFLQAADTGKELARAAPILGKQSLKTTVKTAGLGADAIPFRAGRAVGQFIEHQQKATAYLTALGQGKTIPQALQAAEKVGFDYRNLTAFESQIMRRLVPFYSFARKNVELQLKTLGENPQRINQVLSFFENMGDHPSAEEKQSLPDYLKNSIGIKLSDTPEGLKQYIASFGSPVEAFAQLFNSNPVLFALSQTNPLIKTPIELGTGKNSFKQMDLKDDYNAKEYKNAPQIVKDLLQIKEVQKDILSKDASGKLQKTGERAEYVADPYRLLIARSLFTSRGITYLDQIFGGDMEGFVKYLKLTTGIKPTEINIEVIQSIKDRDTKRALEDLLVKYEAAERFTRTFVPEED